MLNKLKKKFADKNLKCCNYSVLVLAYFSANMCVCFFSLPANKKKIKLSFLNDLKKKREKLSLFDTLFMLFIFSLFQRKGLVVTMRLDLSRTKANLNNMKKK